MGCRKVLLILLYLVRGSRLLDVSTCTDPLLTSMKIANNTCQNDSLSLAEEESHRALRVIAQVYRPLLGEVLFTKVIKASVRKFSKLRGELLGALRSSLREGKKINLLKQIALRSFDPANSSFLNFPSAVSQFCADHLNDLRISPRSKIFNQTTAAVCLVGVPRTFSRHDVYRSIYYRFLAGWGLRETKVFALLVDDGMADDERQRVESLLRNMWYVFEISLPDIVVPSSRFLLPRSKMATNHGSAWSQAIGSTAAVM